MCTRQKRQPGREEQTRKSADYVGIGIARLPLVLTGTSRPVNCTVVRHAVALLLLLLLLLDKPPAR